MSLQHKLQVPQILSVMLRSPDPLYRILWPQMWHCAGVSISALKRGNRCPWERSPDQSYQNGKLELAAPNGQLAVFRERCRFRLNGRRLGHTVLSFPTLKKSGGNRELCVQAKRTPGRVYRAAMAFALFNKASAIRMLAMSISLPSRDTAPFPFFAA